MARPVETKDGERALFQLTARNNLKNKLNHAIRLRPRCWLLAQLYSLKTVFIIIKN